MNSPLRTASPGAHFSDGADAADRGHAVAHGAARAVEGRAEPFIRGLDFEEVVQSEPELLELDRRDAGQRVARHGHADLSDEHRPGKRDKADKRSHREQTDTWRSCSPMTVTPR